MVGLQNLLVLPADSGVKLRDGKALAAGLICREAGPNDRRTARSETRSPATLNVCGLQMTSYFGCQHALMK